MAKAIAALPDVPSTIPVPMNIAGFPAAVRVWNFLARRLTELRLLEDGDHVTFGRYCWYTARWCALAEEIETGDCWSTVKTTGGHGEMDRVRGPFKALMEVERVLDSLGQQFGTSPQSRYRLQALVMQIRQPAPAEGDLLAGTGPAADSPVGFVSGGQRTH